MPSFDHTLILHVNGSDVAIGVVLTLSHDVMDLPVAYFSKKLTDMEAWWSIYEWEMYAII